MVALLSEEWALVDASPTVGAITTAHVSPWINLGELKHVMWMLNTGLISLFGSILITILQATNNAGAGSKTLAGFPKTFSAPLGSNKQHRFLLDAEDLDIDNDFSHIQLVVSGSSGPNFWQSSLYAGNVPDEPADQFNDSTVAEIVS